MFLFLKTTTRTYPQIVILDLFRARIHTHRNATSTITKTKNLLPASANRQKRVRVAARLGGRLLLHAIIVQVPALLLLSIQDSTLETEFRALVFSLAPDIFGFVGRRFGLRMLVRLLDREQLDAEAEEE